MHLQHSAEQILRCSSEETNLRIGVHAIEVGALRRKVFRNVLVVANVVKVGWGGKARGQQELTIKLGESILTT